MYVYKYIYMYSTMYTLDASKDLQTYVFVTEL